MNMAKLSILLSLLMFALFQTTFGKTECQFGLDLCDWEPWSAWSTCSRSCGEGTQARTRGLCCSVGEEFDACLSKCNIKDEAVETMKCGSVCPAGNCTFSEVTDTGIEATDFQLLYNTDNKVINQPILLLSDKEFCSQSCEQANLENGLFCWGYSYDNAKARCHLHFFTKPFTIVNTTLQGQSPGQSVFVRSCEERVACRATSADIVFVVDSSGSIGAENFQKMKVFLEGLVNKLDIDSDLTRVSILVFNDKTKWVFKLGELNTKMDVLLAIQRIQYVIGGTMTGEALNVVRTEGFVNNRTGVPLITVVITDGLSRYPPLTRFQASLLRREGVDVYAIGVGSYAKHEELFNIASSPEEKHMFEFGDFDLLNADNISLPVNYVACKAVVPITTPAPATTVTTGNCFDTVDNCASYGQDVCTDYTPWARAHCALFCQFCEGPTTAEPVCEDKIPNCDSFGQFYCQDRQYVGWVKENCPKYCGLCSAPTVATTPSTVPTTTVSICRDKIDNCDSYLSSCDNEQFRGFLNERCAATCGFCESFKTINSTMVNGKECPEWYIPTECYMESADADCCPIPKCPTSSYKYTAEKSI